MELTMKKLLFAILNPCLLKCMEIWNGITGRSSVTCLRTTIARDVDIAHPFMSAKTPQVIPVALSLTVNSIKPPKNPVPSHLSPTSTMGPLCSHALRPKIS